MGFKTILGIMMVVGIAIAVASLALLTGMTSAIWSTVGVGIFGISAIIMILSSLYLKAKGNQAYYRTGMGGPKVIKDGGALVVPMVHEIIPVSLETMKISVNRKGKDALITADYLRAEIEAEFYIRVKADDDDNITIEAEIEADDKDVKAGGKKKRGKTIVIQGAGIRTAARTLGSKIAVKTGGNTRMGDRELLDAQTAAVSEFVQEKLVDALRTIAATKPLDDLNRKRDDFKTEVVKMVEDGLAQNGLELEDCTISSLDQAPMEDLRDDNFFDAQGKKNLQKVISAARIQKNEFEQNAELEVTKTNVATKKSILTEQQDQAFAEAEQQRQVRVQKADQDREATVKEIEARQAEEAREIEKGKVIQTAEVEKQQAIEAANVKKTQVIETAEVQKEQAVEVAERDKQISIVKKEAETAAAEEERQKAEKAAEQARQDVKTVTITETANREKKKAIIDKEATVEQQRLEEQMEAEVKAYAVIKKAEGDKEAAQADYEARTKSAEADLIQKTKSAEGDKAQAMVPVDVAAAQVKVDKDRVETVLKPELAAKAEFNEISVQLTLGQAEIETKKAIGVAMANALGLMTSKANMTIFGDPTTMADMAAKFNTGVGIGNYMDGLMKSEGLQNLMPMITALAAKAGINVPGMPSVDDLLDAAAADTASADAADTETDTEK